jgi:hypothetical protein
LNSKDSPEAALPQRLPGGDVGRLSWAGNPNLGISLKKRSESPQGFAAVADLVLLVG